MSEHVFHQLDVFSDQRLLGNPLAVVHGADGLSAERMATFARWTNLSETTFLLSPTDPAADYRVRIFTPARELPFAGHPTLGSCHAWLLAGGMPRGGDRIMQQCAAGLITVHRSEDMLAFEAPPLQRSGPLDESDVMTIAQALGIPRDAIIGHQWADNGPGWRVVRLASREAVLALRPDVARLNGFKLGVVGAWTGGGECQFEVRAFFDHDGVPCEDPVTGSLNAGIAQWLIGAGLAPEAYVASQGTALARRGRVHVAKASDGSIRVGGQVVACVTGQVSL